jgi:hypothetical protein
MSAFQHAALVIPSISLGIGGAANSAAIVTHDVGRKAIRVDAYDVVSGAPWPGIEVSQPSVNQIVVGNTSALAGDLRLMIVFE